METSPCELPPTKIECKATIQNPEPMASTRNDNGRPDGAEGNEVKGAVLSSSISSDGDKSSSTDSEGNAKPVSINGGAESTTAIKSSYRDYSRVPPERKDASLSLTALTASTKEHTFPVKLHMILSSPDFHEIIGWLPHGRSWRILQQKAFEERIIPLYFRHGRYSSFARQVNGWGFRRITHGTDYNSYYHEVRKDLTKSDHSILMVSVAQKLLRGRILVLERVLSILCCSISAPCLTFLCHVNFSSTSTMYTTTTAFSSWNSLSLR
jgi:hypothetical protein